MGKLFVESHPSHSIRSKSHNLLHEFNAITKIEQDHFERLITRIILVKATLGSVLLICLNLSILGVVDYPVASTSYLLSAIFCIAALVALYLTPSITCALWLHNNFFTRSQLKKRH